MTIRTEQDIIGMKQASEAAAKTLRLMKEYCEPGMTTRDVDQYGGEIIKSCGARSAPILAYRFPGFTCISVNEVAAHGIPSSNKVLKNGDLVNIDVSVELDGYWSDNGCSFVLGEDYFHLSDLVNASKTILKEAIDLICHNYKMSNLGGFIESQATAKGYQVIRNLNGHGIGKSLHEDPREIANYKDILNIRKFKKDMVVAIETFISTKSTQVKAEKDGWSLVGTKGGFVTQHEHTILITEEKPIILTAANGIWENI